jgi:hypothetical protein
VAAKYALCCRKCGFIEDRAWRAPTETEHSKRTDEPLTPRSQAPVSCPKCGQGPWRIATQDDINAFETKARLAKRAVELATPQPNMMGLFKVPEEIRGSPEVKNALTNLFAPLEGETLRLAQQNALRVARSGVTATSDFWIDAYDQAVAAAMADVKRSEKQTKQTASAAK